MECLVGQVFQVFLVEREIKVANAQLVVMEQKVIKVMLVMMARMDFQEHRAHLVVEECLGC